MVKLIRTAFKYLKKYPFLTRFTLFSIIMASFFEGASFGMLIPLIQSMMNNTLNLFGTVPFLKHFSGIFLSETQFNIISFIFILLFFIILIKNVFIYLSRIFTAKLRFNIMKNLKTNLMDNLIEYDMQYFDSVKKGYLVSNIDAETTRMGDFIANALDLIALLAKVTAYVGLLFLISWRVSIGIFVLIAIVLSPLEFIMKKIKIVGVKISSALVDYNYKLMEILGGIRLIKMSGTENLEKSEFKNATDKTYDLQYSINRYISLIIPLSEVVVFGLIALCFLVMINTIKINIAGVFPFIATYLLVLAKMLTQLNALNDKRSEAMARLAAFLSYDEICDKRGKQKIKSGSKIIDKFSDSIEFKGVNFAYLQYKEVLKNININIPKGRMTALVGASGVGKSTIVNLIARFYESDDGKILVDGIDLKELSLKEWRRKLGFVSQDIFIFNTSVRDNILYGHSGISEEEIIKATEASGAHDFIMELPDKYNTVLGERGVKLSGGEKQRVSIARAIIHNPEILILDEATSSVDTETERLITQAIDRLTKDRTVIAIAHRLSTILHADNIIVLDEGIVVEQGRHADLIKKNGLYKRLSDAQFKLEEQQG